jgi:hypothetical protein
MCTQSVIYRVFDQMPDEWFNRNRIELFYRMVSDAKTFDQEAGQPDCVEPEKEKVLERVEQLEKEMEK